MHDLNDALDELRHVIPYAHSPSVRKLSKIATLLLAKNYILMQTNALNELRRVLICLHQHSGSSLPQTLSASVAALLGNSGSNIPNPVDQLVKHDSWSPGGATVAPVSANLTNARTHLRGFNENEAVVSAAASTTMASIGLNSIAPAPAPATTATTTLLPSSKSSQTSKLVDEQQTTSVQNRRRKYNMLINRILGDVATQHLVNPLQFPHTSPVSINSHKSSLRPIDFCTSHAKGFGANISSSSSGCVGTTGRIGGNMGNCLPTQSRVITCRASAKRKTQEDGSMGSSKQVRLISGVSANQNNMASESSSANLVLDDTSSFSLRSSETSCSSLVSVGSPQFKTQQNIEEQNVAIQTRSQSASTIVSFDEETSETPALADQRIEANKQNIERVHLSI